jgi:hypothetical protein
MNDAVPECVLPLAFQTLSRVIRIYEENRSSQ